MHPTFDYCALQFLNQWLQKESGYCECLASSDIETQRKALISAGGHFRVARNVPKKCEKEHGYARYEPVLAVLNNLNNVSAEDAVDVVEAVSEKISKSYNNRSVLSLTSKFLWLKFKAPIRIYDSQARSSLRTKQNNYLEFNTKFSESFAECKDEIALSCRNLLVVSNYSVQPGISRGELKKLVSKQWFQERVLDIYLWNSANA